MTWLWSNLHRIIDPRNRRRMKAWDQGQPGSRLAAKKTSGRRWKGRV